MNEGGPVPDNSAIEWTEATWNPVTGCDQVSPGCAHCYAKFAERWRGIPGHPYEQGFALRLWPDRLEQPSKWQRPRRIFVNSAEPLLGPLEGLGLDGIDWLIAGGESGPGHRRVDEAWILDLRDRCNAEGVAFFFKQWGGHRPKSNGRELAGRTWDEYPASDRALVLA